MSISIPIRDGQIALRFTDTKMTLVTSAPSPITGAIGDVFYHLDEDEAMTLRDALDAALTSWRAARRVRRDD